MGRLALTRIYPKVYLLLMCLSCYPTEKHPVKFSDDISVKATLQSFKLVYLWLDLYELAKEATKGKLDCSLRDLELWSIDRTELSNPERFGCIAHGYQAQKQLERGLGCMSLKQNVTNLPTNSPKALYSPRTTPMFADHFE